jgi:hypothetical protein
MLPAAPQAFGCAQFLFLKKIRRKNDHAKS